LRCEGCKGLQISPNEDHEILGARKFWVRRGLHMARLSVHHSITWLVGGEFCEKKKFVVFLRCEGWKGLQMSPNEDHYLGYAGSSRVWVSWPTNPLNLIKLIILILGYRTGIPKLNWNSKSLIAILFFDTLPRQTNQNHWAPFPSLWITITVMVVPPFGGGRLVWGVVVVRRVSTAWWSFIVCLRRGGRSSSAAKRCIHTP